MEKKQYDTEKNQNTGPEFEPTIIVMKRGSTTFQIGIQFLPKKKETLDEKLKRLLEKEVENMKNASLEKI